MQDFIDLQISNLRTKYLSKEITPRQVVDYVTSKADAVSDNPIWINRLNKAQLNDYIDKLEKFSIEDLPLFGIPFAIKDNIDLAGVPTTAGCVDFTYQPNDSAFVVERLIAAGAIPIGKTNLDQFATGLVGVRSPELWGPCKNSLNGRYISGGSSSGSSLSVALGLVSFSLGTDTAGSGRVPASLNNIVGLKPSCGLLSTRGVVPACKSLDCVSIFAASALDANTVLDVAAEYDHLDPYSRKNSYANGKRYGLNTLPKKNFKVGVPSVKDLIFFGNDEAVTLFERSKDIVKKCGAELVEIDFSPFVKSAKLLYEGPWVAERYLATQPLIDDSPNSMLAVIETIIGGGKKPTATQCFAAQYELNAYRQQATNELDKVDFVLTPTNGSIYTVEEVQNDPIQLNSNLGFYTNFMNLLDYSAVALPTGFYACEVGFGVTLFYKAFNDKALLAFANQIQQETSMNVGATKARVAAFTENKTAPRSTVDVVVCGAHLQGCVLNWQLSERDAKLVEQTTTSKKYRFYALAGGPPKRPGLVRVDNDGARIDVEVWRMPTENFGSFVAEIPAPLGIGKVELDDGSWKSGFICDAFGLAGADDISSMGSWRKYLGIVSQ